jgi:hypothetical protein
MHGFDGLWEYRPEIGRRGTLEIERKARQQRVEQSCLVRPEFMAFAPTEKCARFSYGRVANHNHRYPGVIPAKAGIQ